MKCLKCPLLCLNYKVQLTGMRANIFVKNVCSFHLSVFLWSLVIFFFVFFFCVILDKVEFQSSTSLMRQHLSPSMVMMMQVMVLADKSCLKCKISYKVLNFFLVDGHDFLRGFIVEGFVFPL